jgi:hypothetical protein
MSHYVEYRTQQTQAFGFCSPSEIQTTFPLAQNVVLRGIRNHTHSDFGPGFCHAENLVTVPSLQTHLYSETLTPRPKQPLLVCASPRERKRAACRRAAWPSTTSMPSLLLLLLQTHAEHIKYSMFTLYILLLPATSMKLQEYDILKGLYRMPPCLPALDCMQEATLRRFCACNRQVKHKHNDGDTDMKDALYSTTGPLGLPSCQPALLGCLLQALWMFIIAACII